MRQKEATNYLAQVPLFAGCSKKELAIIARATDEIDVPDGKVLTEQGEASREAFIITMGNAVVKRNGRKVAELKVGDTVGELGLLDHGERTATVVADGPMRVLVIGRREFLAMLDDVPSIARKMMRSLAGTIRHLDSKSYG